MQKTSTCDSKAANALVAHHRQAETATHVRAWLGVLAASLALGGCGGGGSETSASSPAPVSLPIASTPVELPVPVSAPAAAPSPSPTPVAVQTTVPDPVYAVSNTSEMFRAINLARASVGLGLLRQDLRLDAAASAHTKYMALNSYTGHVEVVGNPGFTGVNSWDRMRAAGYSGSAFEVAALTQQFGADSIIDNYFGAPYHRTPFFHFKSTNVGIGVEIPKSYFNYNSILIGNETGKVQSAGSTKVVNWPYSDMKEVPHTACCEAPNPFAGTRSVWGYPASIHVHEDSKLTIDSFTLVDQSGASVKSFVLTSQSDPNKFLGPYAAYLIPEMPLNKGSMFTATASGTVDGVPFNRTWSFTTKAN